LKLWIFFSSKINLSTTTFLGGGGKRLPEIVILFGQTAGGGDGGASRITNGSVLIQKVNLNDY
jgi:hypothetical protein